MSESAESGTRSLRTLQRWFQAVISDPEGVPGGIASEDAQSFVPLQEDELEGVITRSRRLSAEKRLSVYANAYFARLLECLGDFFPVLKLTLGNELFRDFAFEYLQRYPSRSYTLDRLGDRFADFLSETRPDRGEDGRVPDEPSWPDFLIDLARLEQTIAQVFDGPGIEGGRVLTSDDLGELSPERFGEVCLEPAPCLTLLELRFPLNEYYTTARHAEEDDPAPPMPAPSTQYLAITRRDYVVRRYEVTAPQHALLTGLREGVRVGDAIVQAMSAGKLEGDPGVLLSAWFRDWTAAGCFFVRVVD